MRSGSAPRARTSCRRSSATCGAWTTRWRCSSSTTAEALMLVRPPDDAELERLAGSLGELLRDRSWRLATAESSTGGLIGHAITMIPGASDYYVGGVIGYSNLAKERELGVPAALIAEHGAVSSEVAAAMAEAAWRKFGVEAGLSVTGIAGPDGGSA